MNPQQTPNNEVARLTPERDKRLCQFCGWHGQVEEVLTAANPFDPTYEISGCPRCKEPNTTILVCDEPDCWELITCGTPSTDKDPNKYRHTCSKHIPK